MGGTFFLIEIRKDMCRWTKRALDDGLSFHFTRPSKKTIKSYLINPFISDFCEGKSDLFMLNFVMSTLIPNEAKARNMLTNRLGKLAQPQRLVSSQQSAFIKG